MSHPPPTEAAAVSATGDRDAVPRLRRSLGTLDLVLMSVAAIISFRWLSIAAQIGPSSLTLWALGMLLFFVPSALTVLELSSRLPGEGGIYIWCKDAFGELHAFVVGWCYWVGNLVFFPSLLIFIAGVLLYTRGGSWLTLAASPLYNGAVCVGVLWFATLLNVAGLDRAKWLQNVGGVATWMAGAMIFAGGAIAWHALGSATSFRPSALLPEVTSLRTLASFSAMALAYVGLELGPILGGEIKNPRQTIARAVLTACLVVPALYIAGTAALLVALPAGQINLISGIPQSLAAVGARLGLPAFGAVTAALVALSQVGTLGAWVAGTARLPFLFGLDRYLPRGLGAVHPRFNSPYVALLTQGAITTLILFAALSGSAIHEAFLVLIDMSIILGLIPLIYMFAALPVLRARSEGVPAEGSPIASGSWACWLIAASGIAVTLLGAVVAMIPPTQSANPALIALKVVGGSACLIGIGLAFFFRSHFRSKPKQEGLMRNASILLLTLIALTPRMLSAQAIAPDTAEAGSVEEIAKATTETRFMSPWVAYLPASSSAVSPRSFLHRIPGAPGEFVNTTTAYAYCRALANSSPRVRLFTIGRSEEGRDIVLLAIADEAGIRDLDRLKAATAALADPRRTDEAAAEQLVAGARPIYYFNAGLHSDETGSTESVLELAYRLAVSEQPMIRRIRERLVVLINPISNPDGRDKQVEWFYRYLKGKTDQARLPRQAPPYWSHYAFVDINRDAHQMVHETTKAVFRMMFDWHPQVIHDLHESIAMLLTWNGTNPINEHVDPLTYAERLSLSFHEVQTLTGFGMPGVWTWNFGDDWAHLYLDAIATNHNADGRGYETFGNGSAETMRSEQPDANTSVEWYRPLPAPPVASFLWSARDNVNYNETAMLSALDDTAQQAKTLLRNYYLKGLHSYRKGLDEAPFGFVIPDGQGDPTRVAQLVARLLSLGIEVHRATSALTLKEGTWPAGTYVVRLDQPYRDYAVDLLTPQNFPKDAPEAYDDISWSFPAHYHLTVTPTADPQVRAAVLAPLTEAPHVTGAVAGAGPVFLLRDTGQEELLEARWALRGFRVAIAEHAFTVDGTEYPAGSWILTPQSGLATTVRDTAARLGLDFTSTAAVPQVARHEAPVPRLGVFIPWADTDTAGWMRYSLDQRHIPYIYVRDEDIRAGKLRDKYDVLLYPHVDLELAEQIQGLYKSWGPMPFKKTASTPSFGNPAASDDITGGIGYAGLAELQKFIDAGGLLITLGSGSMLPLEGGLVRGVRREAGGVPRSTQGGGAASAAASQNAETRTPGSHLRVTFARPEHPIAYGYSPRTWVFRQNFALYSIPRRWLRMAYCTVCLDGPIDRSGIVLEWGDKQGAPFVVSGQAWGEENLIGRAAILDMPVGKGHVIAFNFNPLHRDLNRGDQRMLWNAIINWRLIVGAP